MEGLRTFAQPSACFSMWTDDGFARDVLPAFRPNLQKRCTTICALRAGCQAVNSCAAQHSGQLLMFEGKTCSPFGSFTNVAMPFHHLSQSPISEGHLSQSFWQRARRQHLVLANNGSWTH
jgi:hypothetical protein